MGLLYWNELRLLVRDGRGVLLLLVGLALAFVSAATSAGVVSSEREARAHVADHARASWLEREGDNPHSRAHYGDFVYRPVGPLAGLDAGVQSVTGRVLRIEAHSQNAPMHVPEAAASTLMRFSRLDPALVLQILVPLLMVLAGFAGVAGERDSGRVRLLLVQGAKPFGLVLAKAMAVWTVGLALTATVVCVHLVFSGLADAGRLALFAFLHLVLLWVVAVGTIWISSRARSTSAAATLGISAWVLGAIVLPRLTVQLVSETQPLPSRGAFEAEMRTSREEGLNGHDPEDERRAALEQRVLDEYGVATVDELPINIDGIVMQADEDYGNRVWDEHYGQLEDRLTAQLSWVGKVSVLNPFHAASSLSMTLAGTDLKSELAFRHAAELYRRDLVERLNNEHAFGGSRSYDWSWNASQEFYQGFSAFEFEGVELATQVAARKFELIGILAWSVVSVLGLRSAASRLQRGGQP